MQVDCLALQGAPALRGRRTSKRQGVRVSNILLTCLFARDKNNCPWGPPLGGDPSGVIKKPNILGPYLHFSPHGGERGHGVKERQSHKERGE